MTDQTPELVREEWLSRLTSLLQNVRSWAEEFGYSTRVIDTNLSDSQIGKYTAPALLIQEGTIRILLEPIARSAPGVEGVVDLYLMPAYDDIASLYFCDGRWQIHYDFSESRIDSEPEPKLLSKESLRDVLEALKLDAVQ